jgi:hypothetical protein
MKNSLLSFINLRFGEGIASMNCALIVFREFGPPQKRGVTVMMDDTKKSVELNQAEVESLPPAYFDEAANANAQPVQPIPTGIHDWVQRAGKAAQSLNVRTKALALVLVGGLAFGTLGGTLLVNHASSSSLAPPIEPEPTAETTEASDPVADPQLGTDAATLDAVASAVRRADRAASGNRRARTRALVSTPHRAYRVGVIR